MTKARPTLAPMVFVTALVLALPLITFTQNREKFVISAKAGGVNAVTGRASMLPHGNGEWQQLTIKEDLEAGDLVKTGVDGRVEMLLNPGSYLRVGENSEFELSDNSLENLELRVITGTAIVEVTGADDEELFIGITTPHTRMSIVRRVEDSRCLPPPRCRSAGWRRERRPRLRRPRTVPRSRCGTRDR